MITSWILHMIDTWNIWNYLSDDEGVKNDN